MQRYEDARAERESATSDFRRSTRQWPIRYPKGLEEMPLLMSTRWLHEALTKASQDGETVTEEEWDFLRGCNPKVWMQSQGMQSQYITIFTANWN